MSRTGTPTTELPSLDDAFEVSPDVIRAFAGEVRPIMTVIWFADGARVTPRPPSTKSVTSGDGCPAYGRATSRRLS